MLSNFHSPHVNVLVLNLSGYEKRRDVLHPAGRALTTDRSLNRFIMVVFEKIFLVMHRTKYSG